MKTLYLDCGMGAAGDMLAAALLELLPDPDAMIAELNGLGIPGVTFARARAEKCGICGTHLTVTVNGQAEDELPAPAHEHAHEHDHGHDHAHDHAHGEGDLHGIEHIVRALNRPDGGLILLADCGQDQRIVPLPNIAAMAATFWRLAHGTSYAQAVASTPSST